MRSDTFFLGLLISTGMLVPSSAHAQQISEVERLVRHGVELRQQRQPEAALREFQRAYQLGHEPRAVAQSALAEQALERWVDAERDLRAALVSSQDDWIQRHREVLDAALETISQHLGAVMVTGGTPGAEVWINGERVDTLPLTHPVRVVVGEANVEVRVAGSVAQAWRPAVTPGGTVRLDATGAVQPRPSDTVLQPRPQPLQPTSVVVPASVTHTGSTQRTWGVFTLVTGIVAMAGGAGAFAWQAVQVGSFNNDPACRYDAATNEVWPVGTHCLADYNDQKLGEILGIVGVAGGAVSTLIGVILLANAPSSSTHASASVRIGCGQGPGTLGIACGGMF